MVQVEKALKEYFDANDRLKEGLPTVGYLADRVNLSPNYLSDFLKKETGMNAKEHIHQAVLNFTYFGRLLDKLELPDKLKFLKLMLVDRIVVSSEPKIEDITNDTVRLIYNLSSLKVSAKISYENRVKNDDFDLVSKIYDLEFEKGTAIDDDLAIKVGDFLENYAKLTIKVLF